MSVPLKGNRLPKMGKELPMEAKQRRTQTGLATSIANSLNQELRGSRHAIKTAMRWTGAGERTVKGWLAGASEPSGEHLISLIRSFDQVFKCVLDLTDRNELIASKELVILQTHLRKIIVSIDAVLASIPELSDQQ